MLADALDAALPQTQCTRCGYPDCRSYAEAMATNVADYDQCPPGGADGVLRLAALLGAAPKPLNEAFGIEKTAAEVAVVIEADCIGCTKCIAACPVDAISGGANLMHTVIASECTGCELCIPVCPVDCIVLEPAPAMPLPIARAAHSRSRYLARTTRLARREREVREARAELKAATLGGPPTRTEATPFPCA